MSATRQPASLRPTLDQLDPRDVPSAVAADAHPHRFAVGSGAGQSAQVNVYEAGTNALLTTLTPFGRDYTGGTRVATGDLTGDGIIDLVVAAGTGGGQIKVYDGATLKPIADFSAYSPTSRGGANVVVGDVTGDGRADLVVGAGAGNRPQVKVFRGQDIAAGNPKVATTFFAYDANFTGGVRVAVGDVAGNAIGDIIAAPGAGGAPVVKVFAPAAPWGDAATARLRTTVTELTVGGKADTGGVFVAAGDVNGDGKADIAVGRVVGGMGCVSVYDAAGKGSRKLLDGFGYTATEPGGIPVAVRDLNGDGRGEVLAGGGDGVSQVRVLATRGGLARSFMAFPPNYKGGVFVG